MAEASWRDEVRGSVASAAKILADPGPSLPSNQKKRLHTRHIEILFVIIIIIHRESFAQK